MSANDSEIPTPDPSAPAPQGAMPVLVAPNGSQAAVAAQALRAAGIPAEWRSCGETCVVTVPTHLSDQAGEVLAETPGTFEPGMGDRILQWIAVAIVVLLLVTGVLVLVG